jgi:hypothetical protein
MEMRGGEEPSEDCDTGEMGVGGVSDVVGDGGLLLKSGDGSSVSGETGRDSGREILVGSVADTEADG